MTQPTRALAAPPGEGEATWFQPNRMVVKTTGEATGPPDVEKLEQVSALYGAEIVGPPLTPGG